MNVFHAVIWIRIVYNVVSLRIPVYGQPVVSLMSLLEQPVHLAVLHAHYASQDTI